MISDPNLFKLGSHAAQTEDHGSFIHGDILFDMIDGHGTVVHAHVEGEALIDYAGQWPNQNR